MDFMEDQGRSPAGTVKGCHAQQEASQEMYNLAGNGHPVPFFGLVIKGLIMHKFLFIVKAQQGNAIAIDTFRTKQFPNGFKTLLQPVTVKLSWEQNDI